MVNSQPFASVRSLSSVRAHTTARKKKPDNFGAVTSSTAQRFLSFPFLVAPTDERTNKPEGHGTTSKNSPRVAGVERSGAVGYCSAEHVSRSGAGSGAVWKAQKLLSSRYSRAAKRQCIYRSWPGNTSNVAALPPQKLEEEDSAEGTGHRIPPVAVFLFQSCTEQTKVYSLYAKPDITTPKRV